MILSLTTTMDFRHLALVGGTLLLLLVSQLTSAILFADGCGPFDQCKVKSDLGPCQHLLWYFDGHECRTMSYPSCFANPNRFESFPECYLLCVKQPSPSSKCITEPDLGPCQHLLWYFDIRDHTCKKSTNGYCLTNTPNRFETRQDCEKSCGYAKSLVG